MKVIYKILAYVLVIVTIVTTLLMVFSIVDSVMENKNIYVRVILSSFYAISIPVLVTGSLFLPANKFVLEIKSSGVLYYSLILLVVVLIANIFDLVFYPEDKNFFTEKSLYLVAFFGFLLIVMKKHEK
jgi:hypothetical protein